MTSISIKNQIELLEAQQSNIQTQIEKAMSSLIKRKSTDKQSEHNIIIKVDEVQTAVKGLDTYFDNGIGKRVLSYSQEVVASRLYLCEDDYGFPIVNVKITNKEVFMSTLLCDQTGWIREIGDNCISVWADITFLFNTSATYSIVGRSKEGKPKMFYNQRINFQELIDLFRSNEERLLMLYENLAHIQEDMISDIPDYVGDSTTETIKVKEIY